jgi:hypothetical protein
MMQVQLATLLCKVLCDISLLLEPPSVGVLSHFRCSFCSTALITNEAMSLPSPCLCFVLFNADQVQELELSVDLRSLDKLLDFLSCSFQGGTDVDKPLQLSLERLQKDEWAKVGL